MSDPPKQSCGCPKELKNLSSIKNVGRPCKNGEPAWPKTIVEKDSSSAGPSAAVSQSSSLGVSEMPGATADPPTSNPSTSPSPALSVLANECGCNILTAQSQEEGMTRLSHTPSQAGPTPSQPLVADLSPTGPSACPPATVDSDLQTAPKTHLCSLDHAKFDPLSLDSPPFVLRHEPDFGAFSAADIEQPILGSTVDPAALAMISQMIINGLQYDVQSQSLTHSRFKGDIWHLFHQFNIPLSHGLRRPFARALSAAIFLTDSDDKHAVEEVLNHKGISYASKLKSHPQWILFRVRRYVPPPEVLFSRVATIMKTYGPLKDATSGEPLFNVKCWDAVRNLLEHIQNGYYSDPPDIPLFYEIRKDRDGLKLYWCCRGTNDVEGGVHQNLIRYFESFNVSPRCAINMMLVYCVQHNIRTCKHVSMLPFDNNLLKQHPKLRIHHQFLSNLQGTHFTVLPVHTRKECTLFQSLTNSSPLFVGIQQPDFIAIALVFNSHTNGINIFYKLPEHIKAHYKTWLDHVNEKTSTTLSIDLTKRVRDLLTVQIGTPPTIPTAHPQTLADTVTMPMRAPNQVADNPSELVSAATVLTPGKRRGNGNENEWNIKKSKRTCTYCSSMECRGRGGQRFCPKKDLDNQHNTETRTCAEAPAQGSAAGGLK
ncbi:hypothetical protein BDN67DRAFT_1005294 [Paxillus ammoniavirescens]|nr:hypothetical protein BDN67DRAFT_1005294 [Paxillus ammoniavirescens]